MTFSLLANSLPNALDASLSHTYESTLVVFAGPRNLGCCLHQINHDTEPSWEDQQIVVRRCSYLSNPPFTTAAGSETGQRVMQCTRQCLPQEDVIETRSLRRISSDDGRWTRSSTLRVVMDIPSQPQSPHPRVVKS